MHLVCPEVAGSALAIAAIMAKNLYKSEAMAKFKAKFSSSIESEEILIANNLAGAQKDARHMMANREAGEHALDVDWKLDSLPPSRGAK